MSLPRWPMPPDDAGYPRRVAQMVLLPSAAGVAVVLGLEALFGTVVTICILVPAVTVYAIREYRWSKRMEREMEEDLRRWQRLVEGE